MRVIVTGATSFIGAAAVRRLLLNGDSVLSAVRPRSENMGRLRALTEGLPGHEIIEIDLKDIESLDASCDVFIHTAWDGAGSLKRQDREIQMKNAELSEGALRAAKKAGARRFIFTGSQAEYGIKHELIKEDAELSPVSEYGKAKALFGEKAAQYCAQNGIDYIHLRIFSVYGPGDHEGSLVKSCIKGTVREFSDCTQDWNYLYIDDAADAIAHLTREGNAGIYNLAGSETRKLKDFVAQLMEGKGEYSFGKRQQNAEGAADLNPSIEKILKETTWKPETPFCEGIKKLCLSAYPVEKN